MKMLNEDSLTDIHSLTAHNWEKEELPRNLNVAVICLIHKKDDPQFSDNYRGIVLLNVAYLRE